MNCAWWCPRSTRTRALPHRTFVPTLIPRPFITDWLGPFRKSCVHVYHFFQTLSFGWFWCARMGEGQQPRRAFLRGSVPKSQTRAMGDTKKTDAISLEVFLEAEVRISHSHYIQQVLGAKDSAPSQASFSNAEGNENWKEASRRGVRSHLRYREQCGNGQMRSCASGHESPPSLRPFTPSPFYLLHLESNPPPTFSCRLHSAPSGAKIPKRRG